MVLENEPWITNNSQREPFEFEKFDFNASRLWAYKMRPTIGFLAIFYLLLVYCGQMWMKNRPAFKLQKSLIVWNGLHALFSIVCAYRIVVGEFIFLNSGPDFLYRYACTRDGFDAVSIFWAWLFTCGKVIELGDTAFLVLRKKPLLTLHWFHHATVLYFSFFLWAEAEPMARLGVLNCLVHSVMYSYYTLMALRIRVPKLVSMSITSLQLLQFLTGLGLNIYTIFMKMQGIPCIRTDDSIRIQLIVGMSYLGLFSRFFYKAYILNDKGKRD